MHLVFVDIVYGYTADRPDRAEALGGTTSAVCFLAQELVKKGVQVTLVNALEQDSMALGIPTKTLGALGDLCADPHVTAFIFCGRWNAELVQLMRPRARAPFVAWMHEANFENTYVAPLDAFNGVVYVSDWQANINVPFTKTHWKQAVIRNAMNPRFASLFEADEKIMAAKKKKPIILYAGDYQRGAMHVPSILEKLRPLTHDYEVEMYTDSRFSADPEERAAIENHLTQDLGVTHIGKVGQPDLAAAMKRATLFLSPNPWPETSCINLLQAMAAGLFCLTSDRAALPESAHGYSRMIPIAAKDNLVSFGMPVDSTAYAIALAEALQTQEKDPAAWEERQRAQVSFFVGRYQWRTRAQPWIDFITQF